MHVVIDRQSKHHCSTFDERESRRSNKAPTAATARCCYGEEVQHTMATAGVSYFSLFFLSVFARHLESSDHVRFQLYCITYKDRGFPRSKNLLYANCVCNQHSYPKRELLPRASGYTKGLRCEHHSCRSEKPCRHPCVWHSEEP